MSGKNLTFKLVMDADNKGLVSSAKQSEKTINEVFKSIKDGNAKFVADSKITAEAIKNTVPSEVEKKVGQLVSELHGASQALVSLGGDANVSAENLKQLGDYGEKALQGLKDDLQNAKLHLNLLSATKATPEDIAKAQQEVKELEIGVKQVTIAFNGLQGQTKPVLDSIEQSAKAVQDAIVEIVPSETQQRVGRLVTELNTAAKSLDSMGGEAQLSAENLRQFGDYGSAALETLQEDLKQAKLHLNYLAATNATPADIGNAQREVKELETGVKQVKLAFEAYKSSADTATAATAKASEQIANIIPENASKLADALTQSLNSATKMIGEAGDGAKKTANNFTELGAKSEKALSMLKTDLANAKQKLQEFANSKATPGDIEIAQRQVDQLEKEVQQAEQAFNEFQTEVGKANTQLEETGSAAQTAQKGIGALKSGYTALIGVMGGIGIGLGLHELAQAADTYTNLSARINIATREGGNFNQAMAGVHQVALMTNSSLEATGSLFTRINTISKDMGMSQQQALDLTKSVTQAIQIGGGSAQASEAAVQQFIQAMQGGVLRGEEFNSIMENGYGLAEALAKGLGVTTGELRKMAENGELSSERVIKAIQSQADAIQETYNQFPTTISNALQKIATSWRILIGEMDQASGSSAGAANALSAIADNLGIIKVFFDDVGEGFNWFGNKLAELDPSTIESIKTTLAETYETVKNLVASFAGIAETGWSAFTSVLDAVSPLFSALLSGQDDVSGLTTLFNVFRVALGVVSDAATGLNIGLKLLLSGLQFLSGGLSALQSKALSFLGFDALAKQAQDASDRLFAQAEKNAAEAKRLALETKSAAISAIEDMRKTEAEKNAERVADNKKTLNDLKAQEEKHKADYKTISDERLRLEQQLFDARKSGNQASIDLATKGLAELDAKEKAYQAESQKITDAKIESAQAIATAMIQSADSAGMAQLKVLNAELATQGLKAEFDSTGKVIVSAMAISVESVASLEGKLAAGRKAADALGLDLDIVLNRVSEGFSTKQASLDNFANSLELMGLKGKEAGEATYLAWVKWLETAKNPAEVDAAKAKLLEFEKQGVFSTKQVELGVEAIRRVTQQLPDDLDPVEQAFERLGIKTKEQLKLAAQSALADFNTIQSSGKATAEQLKKAYERTMQAAVASCDQVTISAAKAKAAQSGLNVEVDETGNVVVQTYEEMNRAVDRHAQHVSGNAVNAYREMGRAIREEAKSSIEAWNEMMDARSKAAKENKTQRVGADFTTYNVMDIQSKLSGMGYDEAEAAKIAKNILNQGLEIDKNLARDARARGDEYTAKAFEKLLNNGQTSAFGTQKVNELLARYMAGQGSAKSGTKSTSVNALAPEVNVAVPTATVEQPSAKTVTYNLSLGGKTVEVSGDESSQVDMNAFMSELERLKKGM
ncbi:tape measure protein [Acinetobacter zhairhuonensis]|uniref:tape measure protein n=1 Tax=Acinetobacter sp. A7.4 TaxID=2919921 RepID=UPI001F502A83|nr:tape measure protein [Acinetobacter sp. A7.4]MCJ8161861.1 tape measure protein [Acinetobacter sp. A7.4]